MKSVCTLFVLTAAGCLAPAVQAHQAHWSAALVFASPLTSPASRPESEQEEEEKKEEEGMEGGRKAGNSSEQLESETGSRRNCEGWGETSAGWRDHKKCSEADKECAARAAEQGDLKGLLHLDKCAAGGSLLDGSCDSLCLICNDPDKGGFYIRRSKSATEFGRNLTIAAGTLLVGGALGGGVGAVALAGMVGGIAKMNRDASKDENAENQADAVRALFDVPKSCAGTMIYPYNKDGLYDGPPISLQSWEELQGSLQLRKKHPVANQFPDMPKKAWADALLLTRFWGLKHGLLGAERKFAPSMDEADADIYYNARWKELGTQGKILPERLIDSLSMILCDGTGVFSVDPDKDSKANSMKTGSGRALSSAMRMFKSSAGKWESMHKDGVFKEQAEASGFGKTCRAQVAQANGNFKESPPAESRKKRQDAASKSKGHEVLAAEKTMDAELAQQAEQKPSGPTPPAEPADQAGAAGAAGD